MWLFLTAFLLTLVIMGYLLSIVAVRLLSKRPGESSPLTAAEKDQLSASLKRWNELSDQLRGRVQDRLRSLPPSEEREDLIKEYGRQVLGVKD